MEDVIMGSSEYKCVPFIANIATGFFSKDNAGTIASQLQQVITANATDGWEFHSVAQVQTLVKPGCIPSLLGSKEEIIPYDIVCFKRLV
jgi:hypothetical protein